MGGAAQKSRTGIKNRPDGGKDKEEVLCFSFFMRTSKKTRNYLSDEKSGPLSFKEKQEVSQIAFSILLACLQDYHIWICEEIRKLNQE